MLNRKAAWLAIVLATPLAILSTPAKAVAITYSLSGCTANSPINGSLMSAPGSPYAPTSCTSGGGIGGTSALTSVQAISNTGATLLGSLQAAYIGVYPSLGVTSTAGVDSNTSANQFNLTGSTGVLATGTTLVNTGAGQTGSTTTGNIVIESTAAPEHALDNSRNVEGMLLTFNTDVSLTSLSLGYINVDSDLTIYAYSTPGTVANTGLTGGADTWANLTTKGWTKIADLVGGASTFTQSVATTKLSSYWLVAAYTGSTTGSYTAGDDFVKLLSVSACTGTAGCSSGGSGGVPEPSTVLLMGAALLALSQMRRGRTA